MRNHTATGQRDLCWIDDDGGYHHICRYSTQADARAAKERLRNPTQQEQSLIGVPANPTLEIVTR